MVAERQTPAMTVEEYLALEETSQVKHEYVRGWVFAMAGGTLAHDIIANKIRAALHNHVADGPCIILGPDARVRVDQAVYYYADAVVVCDQTIEDRALEITAPRLIVEVLSDSTEAADPGHKFTDYQTLLTTEEYLLVDSRCRSVERFQRAMEGRWTYQRYAEGDVITLESVGLTCAVAAFYRHTHVECRRLPVSHASNGAMSHESGLKATEWMFRVLLQPHRALFTGALEGAVHDPLPYP